MRSTSLWLLAACAAAWLAASPALAQQGQEDVDKLRQQIRDLQGRLLDIEDSAASGRVTQIGGARVGRREPELVVRIYDLGDLFTMAPPYEAQFTSDLKQEDRPIFPRPAVDRVGGPGGMGGMGMGGGMGGGFWSVPDAKPATIVPDASKNVLLQHSDIQLGAGRSSIDDLIKAITSTISPNIWEEVGGPASISSLGASLIVSADEQTHTQIDALLSLFRKRWGTLRTISVRAYWLYLADAELAGLLEGEAARDKSGELPAFGLVSAQAWKKQIEKLAQAGDPRQAGYRAVLTCYNGQTVYAISGGQSLAVTQIQPVLFKPEGSQGEGRVAYRPEVSVIHEGAAIQVTPISSTTSKYVVIDVHSRVVESRPAQAAPKEAKAAGLGGMGGGFEPGPAEVVAALDRPRLVSQRFSTTLRVPVDQPMLVGGMSFEGAHGPGDATLYLFLTVSVQELRDDPAAQKPLEVPGEMAPGPKEKPASPKDQPAPKSPARPAAKAEKKKPAP